MNTIALMARFNAWVNGRLYGCVAGISEEAYREDRKAYFGSMHNTLNPLLVVDRLWTHRIEGSDHDIKSLDQILYGDFESLRAARKTEDEALVDLVDGLSEEELRSPVTYGRMIGDGKHTTRRDHILVTLYNHQTHHRGQVHAMLTQQGIDPPPLDVIYLLEDLGLS